MRDPLFSFPAKISIHALHEESDVSDCSVDKSALISIHALHEESDVHEAVPLCAEYDFNPRSP